MQFVCIIYPLFLVCSPVNQNSPVCCICDNTFCWQPLRSKWKVHSFHTLSWLKTQWAFW